MYYASLFSCIFLSLLTLTPLIFALDTLIQFTFITNNFTSSFLVPLRDSLPHQQDLLVISRCIYWNRSASWYFSKPCTLSSSVFLSLHLLSMPSVVFLFVMAFTTDLSCGQMPGKYPERFCYVPSWLPIHNFKFSSNWSGRVVVSIDNYLFIVVVTIL